MESWQAKIVFQPGRMSTGLFIFRKRDKGIREFLIENDTIMTVTPEKYVDEKDLVFASLDEDQLMAIQNAISDYGIKQPEASFTQGKLEATSEHLTDLRRLVFETGLIKVIQGKETK